MPDPSSLPPPARIPEGLRVHLLAAASMSDALHQQLAKLTQPLRGLGHGRIIDATPDQPARAVAHGGAMFLTGVVVTSGLQLLARLHEIHQQHVVGRVANQTGTRHTRRRFGLWRGFGHRGMHAAHHKEHAYVLYVLVLVLVDTC